MPTTALALQGQQSNGAAAAPPSLSSTTTTTTTTLGFLTFDLDDTLFPTDPVVEDSNHVMIRHMREVYQCPTTLNDFLATTRSIRINNKDNDSPMTYTDLRKRAIRQEFLLRCSSHRKNREIIMQLADQKQRDWQNNNNIDDDNDDDETLQQLDSMVNDCFQIWINERHAAAQRYLFPDALEMLQTIQTTFPQACIAAITNGRGNPLEMSETLAPWFDFCISGEDAQVFPHRKPHAGIYKVALSEYQQRYPLHSLVKHPNNNLLVSSDPTLAQQQEQQQQQHIWCHVGDCLGNDVGASASCGAYAVWLDLESNDRYMGLSPSLRQQQESTAAGASSSSSSSIQEVQQQPSWSTASQSDLEQRAQRANQAKEKIAYSRITSLSELPNAIHKLLLLQ